MKQKKMKIVHVFADGSARESLENIGVPDGQVEEILKIMNKEKSEELKRRNHM